MDRRIFFTFYNMENSSPTQHLLMSNMHSYPFPNLSGCGLGCMCLSNIFSN